MITYFTHTMFFHRYFIFSSRIFFFLYCEHTFRTHFTCRIQSIRKTKTRDKTNTVSSAKQALEDIFLLTHVRVLIYFLLLLKENAGTNVPAFLFYTYMYYVFSLNSYVYSSLAPAKVYLSPLKDSRRACTADRDITF